MRLEQLIYLVEVGQSKSISLASERLNISQPSISLALSELEKELGVKLFQRSRLGTIPTDTGNIMILRAKEILNKIEDFKEIATLQSSLLSGNLSIASIPSLCMSILPGTITSFKDRHPGVMLEIREGGSLQIKKDIINGNVDLGLIAYLESKWTHDEQLTLDKLMTGQIIVYIGRRLANKLYHSVSLLEIIKYPILIFNSEYSMHAHILGLLRRYGEPNVFFTSGNTEAAKRMIAEGIGIGFYMDVAAKIDPYVHTGEIIPMILAEEMEPIAFGLIRSKQKPFSTVAREFKRELYAQVKAFLTQVNEVDRDS